MLSGGFPKGQAERGCGAQEAGGEHCLGTVPQAELGRALAGSHLELSTRTSLPEQETHRKGLQS